MLKKLKRFALWPAIIWGIVLAVLMLLPQDSFPESKLLSYDKLAHVVVFTIFSLLVLTGIELKRSSKSNNNSRRITLTICLVYGILLEGLQSYVPGRMSDIYDLIANFTGGLLGVILFSFFIKNKLAIHKLIL